MYYSNKTEYCSLHCTCKVHLTKCVGSSVNSKHVNWLKHSTQKDMLHKFNTDAQKYKIGHFCIDVYIRNVKCSLSTLIVLIHVHSLLTFGIFFVAIGPVQCDGLSDSIVKLFILLPILLILSLCRMYLCILWMYWHH